MVSVNDIKQAAKLFDYGDNKDAGQISDDEIQNLIDKISEDVNGWISSLKINVGATYNIDRYISLEVIIALALSNYNDSQKTYIEALKLERDRYKEMLEKNVRRFGVSRSVPKMPSYTEGGVFE